MKVEIRQNQVTISGYVNVYNRDSKTLPSPTGTFVEQIEVGAFDNQLDNVQLLFNHNESRKLGSTSEGTLKLESDVIGLKATATITDEEVITEARAGNLKGWSFGFKAVEDTWEDIANGIQRRFVKALELIEVSILNVTPAYNALSLEVRNEVEQRFNETTIDMKEVVELTPEERQLLQEKAELAEQRSEDAMNKLGEIEQRLAELKTEKRGVVNMENKFESMEYRVAFINALTGKATTEERALLESNTGGLVVPRTIQAEVERLLKLYSPIRNLARVVVSASNLTIPMELTGATANWTAEASPITESSPTLQKVDFNAHKLAVLVKVSNELIADSVVAIESYIAELIAEEIAQKEGVAFISGDGTGKPTGIVNGLTPTALADVITYDLLVDFFMSLPAQYRANGAFLVAEDVYTELLKLKDTAGRPLLNSVGNSISGQPEYTLFGKTIHIEPNLTAKHAIFADFKRAYAIVDRSAMVIRSTSERYIDEDMTGIIATKRTDGKRLNASAMKYVAFTA